MFSSKVILHLTFSHAQKLLIAQLAVLYWVNARPYINANSTILILDKCSAWLEAMIEKPNPTLQNDVSRSPLMFPAAMAALMGSVCVLFSGYAPIHHNVSSLSNQVLTQLNQGFHQTCHPLILRAVRVLANSKPGDLETKEGLLHCCFLLNST